MKSRCWVAFTSAPAASSIRQTSWWRPGAALWRGWTRISLPEYTPTTAPASMSVRAASALPKNAAKWSAVNPSADYATARARVLVQALTQPIDIAEGGRLEDVQVRIGRHQGVRRPAMESVARQHQDRDAVPVACGGQGRIAGEQLRHPRHVICVDGVDQFLGRLALALPVDGH